jgi:hypothetical protein
VSASFVVVEMTPVAALPGTRERANLVRGATSKCSGEGACWWRRREPVDGAPRFDDKAAPTARRRSRLMAEGLNQVLRFRPRPRAALLVMSLASLLLVSAGCTKKPPKQGDPCAQDGASVCIDEHTRLKCMEGSYTLEHCAECIQSSKSSFGSKTSTQSFVGCVYGGDGPEGGHCPIDMADCADATTEVACVDGKYHHYPCKGGCSRKGTTVTCVAGPSEPGTPCLNKLTACSTDGKSLLECKDGKLAVASVCGGPKGCSIADDLISCDTSISTVGQICKSGGGCSADHKDLISCVAGKYAVGRRCRGKDPRCEEKDAKWHCVDPTVLRAGDPCVGDARGCSEDGHALLECKDGALAVQDTCKKGCKGNDPSPGRLTCHN